MSDLQTENAELHAKLAAAEAEAERSTKRLAELSEPGSIGAFARRDHALEQVATLTRQLDEARAANVAMRTALNEAEGDMMSIAAGMRGFAIGVPPDPQGIIDWSEWAANRIEKALAPNPGQQLLDELERLRVEAKK